MKKVADSKFRIVRKGYEQKDVDAYIAKTEADAAAAEEELLKCYTFSDEAPIRPPFIRGVVT